jgi:ubiquinone/menaquinone biosynthesis C-methylase UbiE
VNKEAQLQRAYYAKTAEHYEDMHVSFDSSDPHYIALCLLVSSLDFVDGYSLLDIGSGTGRVLRHVQHYRPSTRVLGVEPVRELREVGYERGVNPEELVDGDATRLKYEADSFDVVCEFGVLHHVKEPNKVVAEMLRVAKKAIFISDSNNFGQGSLFGRSVKQMINALGMWRAVVWAKTGGRGYMESEEEGISYSYSVFNNIEQIRQACKSVHLLNTEGGKDNFYRDAAHVAILGIKKER